MNDTPKQGIVDRIARDFVVIEMDGETRDVPRALVADNVKEGDVVEWTDGRWTTNDQATQDRTAQIKALMDSVWED